MASVPGLRAESPIPSGRLSPGNARLRQLDEENLGKKDKSYRRYAATVERVLASFDTAIEEWADYISFLGRLQKALAARPSGSREIAHKSLVSKRLSQCLNPTLPSGVHQKSLEVYAYIFETIGKDGLANDLAIYLPGLAPALTFASLSVKPNILSIFENFIADLNAIALRPALKALVLALLPGLEEENSEEFERCLSLLDRFRRTIANTDVGPNTEKKEFSDHYFWQCLFLCSVTSSSRRPGALAYLVRRLPTLGKASKPVIQETNEDAEKNAADDEANRLQEAICSVASPEPGLLIRCFCAGLQDDQILVQRGFLDLLLTHLPLDSPVLQNMSSEEDLQILIGAATMVVARRDMSLNRRLWSWFLGPEPAPDNSVSAALSPTSPAEPKAHTPKHETHISQIRYFEEYGLPALTACMKEMIDKDIRDPSARARPLRVCISLMDKWDIGAMVVPPLFLRALRSAWKYQNLPLSKEAHQEVLRSANMFFDAVESGIIWAELQKLLNQALGSWTSDGAESLEMLEFLLFILNKFNVREEEMQIVHMPLVAVFSLFRLLSKVQNAGANGQGANPEIVVQTLKILHKLLELIPQRALKSESKEKEESPENEDLSEKEIETLLDNITSFYAKDQGNVEVRQPLREQQVGRYLICSILRLTSEVLQPSPYSTHSIIELAISLLGQTLRKNPPKDSSVYQLIETFQKESNQDSASPETDDDFSLTVARISALEVVFGTPHSASWIPAPSIRRLVADLTKQLWPRLSPSRLKSNVEAARSLWKLHIISPDAQLVESTIAALMLRETRTDSDAIELEDARRFEVLWIHSPVTSVVSDHRRGSSTSRVKLEASRTGKDSSELLLLERPLMILLDMLHSPRSPLSQFVTNWLQSLPSVLPIVKALNARIRTFSVENGASEPLQENGHPVSIAEDWNTYLYYLQTMLNLVQSAPESIWNALGKNNAISEDGPRTTFNDFLVQICLSILRLPNTTNTSTDATGIKLKQCALTLLNQILTGPLAETVRDREIEICLLQELKKAVEDSQHTLQISILDVTFSALKLCLAGRRFVPGPITDESEQTPISPKKPPDLRVVTTDLRKNTTPQPSPLPSLLLDCLELGLRSVHTRPVLENWIAFLSHCLPLYQHSIFQVLLPLVQCFCETLEEVLDELKAMFSTSKRDSSDISEPTIALLLTGTEQTLATAHDQLAMEEAKATPVKVPEQPNSGFFGGMVSGVFNAEALKTTKSSTGNKRLTVLICFKDAIRMCFKIWSWGDSGKDASLGDMSATHSFSYITLRLRNRTRRLFEHLFAVEPLECLETLVDFWQSFAKEDDVTGTSAVLHLLNALESSRPKNTIPAIFNAIYSRTNPAALENSRRSSLTSDLADTSLASFLVSYAMSLEDDAMDEIWTDCVTFLRDVLGNPMPHRQTLAKLLEFTAVLGVKVDKTNFGEQRKMRRDLGDLFNRLLTATLTIRPIASWPDEKSSSENASRASLENRTVLGDESLISVLAAIAPNIPKVLVDSDRLTATTTVISTQVIGPTVKSKTFPDNISHRAFDLLKALSTIPEASKTFKKDLNDAFNDTRFFSTPLELAKDGWLPLLKSSAVGDKDRMAELISRLPYPSSAGVLGIGASSARAAADYQTQLNLRRIALLILAAGKDSFVGSLAPLQGKLFDLLSASSSSSPSFNTRAEIYMVIRAIALRVSPVHLSSFWPTLNSELADSLSSVHPTATEETLPPACLLHACKLLDLLVSLGLDDFQLQEWLFISDTTDALYRPDNVHSVALADNLNESLDEKDGSGIHSTTIQLSSETPDQRRKPLLAGKFTREISLENSVEKIIRPFLRQLSIQAFESNYGMHALAEEECADDLLADIFDDRTIVA